MQTDARIIINKSKLHLTIAVRLFKVYPLVPEFLSFERLVGWLIDSICIFWFSQKLFQKSECEKLQIVARKILHVPLIRFIFVMQFLPRLFRTNKKYTDFFCMLILVVYSLYSRMSFKIDVFLKIILRHSNFINYYRLELHKIQSLL